MRKREYATWRRNRVFNAYQRAWRPLGEAGVLTPLDNYVLPHAFDPATREKLRAMTVGVRSPSHLAQMNSEQDRADARLGFCALLLLHAEALLEAVDPEAAAFHAWHLRDCERDLDSLYEMPDATPSDFVSGRVGALVGSGKRLSRTNAAKGQAGAAARWEGAEDLGGIVALLARMRDELGDPLEPGALWPELYAALDETGKRPREKHDIIAFMGGSISYNAFRARIQRLRRKKT